MDTADHARIERQQSIVVQLENAITRFFYGRAAAEARRRCYTAGLQCPLWLWTHHGVEDTARSDPPSRSHPRLSKVSGAGEEREDGEKDAKAELKAIHLIAWCLHNGLEASRVAVMLPLSRKAAFVQALGEHLRRRHHAGAEAQLPIVLAHHELAAMNARDGRHYSYDLVLYLLALAPRRELVARGVAQERYLAEALVAAQCGLVLLADAGWTGPTSPLLSAWPQWRLFVEKLREEQPPVSFDSHTVGPAADCFAQGMVGASLPLCCARHPQQRQLAHGLTEVVPECRRSCLRHFDCGCAQHLCEARCHPAHRHTHCPYACPRAMACGHACLLPCAARCNCFEVVEHALPCAHTEVLGLDPDTLQPITATVPHYFRGVCADAHLPCAVEYGTECARCLGPMRVKCFEAQEQHHTYEHRTMLCASCRRVEKELRAQVLGEVLREVQQERRRLRVELERSVHQQRKAAAQGLFRPGTRVEITDVSKCVPPLFAAEDFPGVAFVDLDDAAVCARLSGAYGTFLSNHVDVMDRAEVRNLVRLPDGLHVLVTDGGLRMIRALTGSSAGAAAASSQVLMLTENKTDTASEKENNNSSGGSDEGDNGKAVDTNTSAFDAARACVGQTMYLAQPVPCGVVLDTSTTGEGGEEETEAAAATTTTAGEEEHTSASQAGLVSDKVVQVLGIDPAAADRVMVGCTLFTMLPAVAAATQDTTTTAAAAADSTTASRNESSDDGDGSSSEPAMQRRRLEGDRTDAHITIAATATRSNGGGKDGVSCTSGVGGDVCGRVSAYTGDAVPLLFSAPLSVLEPLTGLSVGKHVFVSAPTRQMRHPHQLELLQAMLREMDRHASPSPVKLSEAVLSAAPLDANTAYTLAGIVNPPLNMSCGPCALLAYPAVSSAVSKAGAGRTYSANARRKAGQQEGQAAASRKRPIRLEDTHHNGENERSTPAEAAAAAVPRLAVIPFVYLTPDELAEAESALDAEAQRRFEAKLREALQSASAAMAERNEEDTFHAQQQMPAVTPAARSEARRAYSVPVPLPSAEQIAEARRGAVNLVVGSAVRERILRAKDSLAAKQETLQLHAVWMSQLRERLKADREADAMYLRRLQSEQQLMRARLR